MWAALQSENLTQRSNDLETSRRPGTSRLAGCSMRRATRCWRANREALSFIDGFPQLGLREKVGKQGWAVGERCCPCQGKAGICDLISRIGILCCRSLDQDSLRRQIRPGAPSDGFCGEESVDVPCRCRRTPGLGLEQTSSRRRPAKPLSPLQVRRAGTAIFTSRGLAGTMFAGFIQEYIQV
jgi:hypothetical protein